MNLHLNVFDMECASPITVASGTFGSGKEFDPFVNLELLAAVTSKGVASSPWQGNEGIRIAETASGMLNSIGLQNPGAEVFLNREVSYLKENAPRANLIVNIVGNSIAQYVEAIEMLEDEDYIDAYEINISCPNVESGGIGFGMECSSAEAVTAATRSATDKPLIIKLSPNVTNISEIAKSVEAVGADGISLINTLLGYAIDLNTFKPVFKRGVAGLSGPAIKPVALRCVREVYKSVEIPIIGMGGVTTGTDIAEFMLAGATLVSIGTANFMRPDITMRAIEDFRIFLATRGIKHAKDLIGALDEF